MLVYLQIASLPECDFNISFSDIDGNALDVDETSLHVHFQSLHHSHRGIEISSCLPEGHCSMPQLFLHCSRREGSMLAGGSANISLAVQDDLYLLEKTQPTPWVPLKLLQHASS